MKIVKDDWEFKIERVDSEMLYSAHYSVVSEGVEQNRGMPIEFNTQEEAKLKKFIKDVVRTKVEEHESGN